MLGILKVLMTFEYLTVFANPEGKGVGCVFSNQSPFKFCMALETQQMPLYTNFYKKKQGVIGI